MTNDQIENIMTRALADDRFLADLLADPQKAAASLGIDPQGLREPSRHLDHRLRHGRLAWFGAQTTPLEALARYAPVGGRLYPVIPRGVTFDHVSALLGLLPAERACKLSLFGGLPSRELALRGIADAVNLDPDMASDSELQDVARFFHKQAIHLLAQAIRCAWQTVPGGTPMRAIAFGCGSF